MFMGPGTSYCYTLMVCTNNLFDSSTLAKFGPPLSLTSPQQSTCFNISSSGEGAAALIRAIEPIEGTSVMEKHRRSTKLGAKPLKNTQIGSGPGKLCQAMKISMDFDGKDLITLDVRIYVLVIWLRDLTELVAGQELFLEKGKPVPDDQIIADARINVEYAGSIWGYKELRFTIKNNPHVSKKPGAPRSSDPW